MLESGCMSMGSRLDMGIGVVLYRLGSSCGVVQGCWMGCSLWLGVADWRRGKMWMVWTSSCCRNKLTWRAGSSNNWKESRSYRLRRGLDSIGHWHSIHLVLAGVG